MRYNVMCIPFRDMRARIPVNSSFKGPACWPLFISIPLEGLAHPVHIMTLLLPDTPRVQDNDFEEDVQSAIATDSATEKVS